MNKCVCDICRDSTASQKLKVRRQPLLGNWLHVRRWVRIDICSDCYNRLMKLEDGLDLEIVINNFVCTDNHLQRYENIELQTAYVNGFQAVLNLLIQNKILKK